MYIKALLLVGVFVVSACNTSHRTGEGYKSAAGGNKLICTKEVPTGSHRPVTTCSTKAKRDAEAEAGREFLRAANAP